MSAVPPPPIPGRLRLALVLVLVTGFVDALAFARTGTFVANMTGNTVLLGIGIGDWSAAGAVPPLVAIAAFLAGSVLAAAVRRARPRPVAARPVLLAAEAALLAVTALIVLVAGTGTPVRADRYSVIVLGSVAMALQTDVVRRVGGVAVSTTFDTGMIASLGAAIAHRSRAVAAVVGPVIAVYVAGAALGGLAARTDPRLLALAAPAVLAVLAALLLRRR
ncbi:MAG: DUF1275 domain-containing protein [Thermoleophilia bacterium]|nr:DUF1275 domain-containing protein [Thermoleophilia bacterium]